MKKLCLALVLVAAMVGSAWAEEVKLFKGYYYGMDEKQVKEKSNAIPCQDESLQGNLCAREKVKFANHQWEQIFSIQDGKLVQVVLGKKYTDQSFVKTAKAVAGNKFIMLAALSNVGQFDGVQVLRQKGPSKFDTELAKWEMASINSPRITYSFFDEENVKKVLEASAPQNIAELTKKLAPNTRSVEIIKNNGYILLSFLAPLAALQDMKKDASGAKEEF